MRNIYQIIAMAILFFGISSCQDDKLEPEANVIVPESANLMELEAYGYEQPIQISANDDWTIECEGEWFYTIPESGASGTYDLLICVRPNMEGEKQPGKLIINFKGGGQKIIELQQKVKDDNATATEGNKRYGIGYGYNCGGVYPHPDAVLGEIFDMAKLKDKIIANSGAAKLEFSTITGNSIEEVSSKLTSNVGVSGKCFGFSGEMKASFDANYFNSQYSEFARHSGGFILKSYSFDVSEDDLLDSYINKSAQNAIDGTDKRGRYKGDAGIKKLIDNYGTHVIIRNAYQGGRYDISTTIEREKIEGDYDINVYAKAAYANSFAQASAEVNADQLASFKKNEAACHTVIRTVGGSSDAILKIAEDKEGIDKWKSSLTDDKNIALMDFDATSLIPIWELCSDGIESPRAKAIQAYVENPALFNGSVVTTKMVRKINIPSFGTVSNATLVKTAEVDGIPMVEICNEYIPNLSATQRVTVAYPILNGVTQYKYGYFLGSKYYRPGTLSWNGAQYTYREDSDLPKGELKTVYCQGLSFMATKPNVTADRIQETTIKDQVFNTLHSYNHPNSRVNHPLVKVSSNTWTRTSSWSDISGNGITPIYWATELPTDVPRWTDIQYNNSGYNLYNRVAANSLQVASWKIPSDDECNSLINYVNKEPSKIISKGVSGLEIALCGIWEAYSKTLSFSGIEGSIWCGAGYNFMRITNPEMSVSSVQTPHGNSYGYSVRLVRAPEFKYY